MSLLLSLTMFANIFFTVVIYKEIDISHPVFAVVCQVVEHFY